MAGRGAPRRRERKTNPDRNLESGASRSEKRPGRARTAIAHGFTRVEDVVYVALGVLLAVSAAALLISGAAALWKTVWAGAPVTHVINVLDRILVVLMIVELLYTVKVSFREHALVPEPFLIVGLIAVTRRILVVTAQFTTMLEKPDEVAFRNAIVELALLTVMVVALVGSLLMLRKRAAPPAESS
ncbi:MAG TPA: phosphate-starvation-inducible PsiE family protein [Candidatus Eisenbacteria bacterium]